MKLILILACIAVLARSGPLPACLLDEAFESFFSVSPAPDDAALTDAIGPKVALPDGDDTPEQVAQDRILQQSMGHLQQPSVAPHDDAAHSGIAFVDCAAACNASPADAFALGFFTPPSLPPPKFSPSQYYPLLI